jgi:hypothetical protein
VCLGICLNKGYEPIARVMHYSTNTFLTSILAMAMVMLKYHHRLFPALSEVLNVASVKVGGWPTSQRRRMFLNIAISRRRGAPFLAFFARSGGFPSSCAMTLLRNATRAKRMPISRVRRRTCL